MHSFLFVLLINVILKHFLFIFTVFETGSRQSQKPLRTETEQVLCTDGKRPLWTSRKLVFSEYLGWYNGF